MSSWKEVEIDCMSPYIVIYSKKLRKIGEKYGNGDFYLYYCIVNNCHR